MTDKDDKTGRDNPVQSETLSATGLFLRAFEAVPDPSKQSPVPPAQEAAPKVAEASQPAPSSGPGEFTRVFQASAAVPAGPATPSPSPVDAGPGEFTRISVSGKSSSGTTPAPGVDELSRPAPPAAAAPGRAKGFSTQGSFDSASGEGSFTQFFKAAGPAAPVPSSAPRPPAPAEFSLSDQIARQNRDSSPAAEPSGQSVTSLLSSLSSPIGGSTSSGPPEPAPYRAASPAPFSPAPFQTPASRPADAPMESGGVTRLIQKLTQEQSSVAPAPQPPVAPAPPPSSGPGDFTRMISKLVDQTPPAAATSPLSPAVSAPPAAAPAPFQVAVPPLRPAMPAAPAIPSIPAPAAFAAPAAPKPSPVPAPAFAAPAAPKLPPVPAPGVAKGKFEALVPVLLVVNTFLLLLVLVVVLFLARGR